VKMGEAESTFEIFIQPGFSEQELASVISVLRAANEALNRNRFSWQLTSDSPGFVESGSEILARANPAIGSQYLHDCLFVIAGHDRSINAWMARVRAMQSLERRVVLLSDASREYVKAMKGDHRPATIHWRDVILLREIGDYPELSERLGEEDGCIVTCAGHGHTSEAVISVLADFLKPQECLEIAQLLLIENVRGFDCEQPKSLCVDLDSIDKRLQRAVRIMEDNLEDPLPMSDLAIQAGVSSRHLERLFRVKLNTTPARYYRKLRLKRGRILVRSTDMAFIEIALACGFSTAASFSQAFKAEFGKAPAHFRGLTFLS